MIFEFSPYIWVGLATIMAMATAGMAIESEVQKHPTIARLFWVRLFSFVAVAPLMPFVHWPDSALFYQCLAAITALICVTDVLYYSSAKNNGAGATTRIEPLSVLLTFVVWTCFSPGMLQDYISRPWHGAGVVMCFAVAAFCAMRLRGTPVDRAALKALLPTVVLLSIVVMLGKIAMDAVTYKLDAIIVYLGIQCLFLAGVYFVAAKLFPRRIPTLAPGKALLQSALAMAAMSITHIGMKYVAYTYVPNPAYVTVVGLTAPLFVIGFYRLTGRRDGSDVLAGFGIVLSALVLVILTHF